MSDTFPLGRVFASPGTKAALSRGELASLLQRHVAGERRATGSALQIVSEFAVHRLRGEVIQVWVVTEPSRTRAVDAR